ncbi:MAG TPA: FapA family protein, partial [Lachnospiraceae bacterium]|nr:FapA family protein [Lachnospiraceae bacterium]
MVNFDTDCRVIIADDNMSAKVYLTPPTPGNPYTVEDIADFLRHNGVNGGIIFSVLESIIRDGLYYYEIEVAKGSEPVHGQNGWYEFFFNQEEIKHPLIRSDGSVDYQSMSIIENISIGDVLAVYHPAVQGSHGMDVKGRDFRAKPGKELPQLRGAGFERSYDGNTYTATIEGKVEYDNFKLYIRDVYEFRGDLDLVVG